MDTVRATLAHYDDCRALADDVLRLIGPDSAEYARAERAKRVARLLLDSALAARRAGAGHAGQAVPDAAPGAGSAEGFAAWLEGCGYPPPRGPAPAASWAEMLTGYRAYVREGVSEARAATTVEPFGGKGE